VRAKKGSHCVRAPGQALREQSSDKPALQEGEKDGIREEKNTESKTRRMPASANSKGIACPEFRRSMLCSARGNAIFQKKKRRNDGEKRKRFTCESKPIAAKR